MACVVTVAAAVAFPGSSIGEASGAGELLGALAGDGKSPGPFSWDEFSLAGGVGLGLGLRLGLGVAAFMTSATIKLARKSRAFFMGGFLS